MGRDATAAGTLGLLLGAWGVTVVMSLTSLRVPGVPGVLGVGLLAILSGLHMVVFRRWRVALNRRWQQIPGMMGGRATASLWVGFGALFVAFGLLLSWAGLLAVLR